MIYLYPRQVVMPRINQLLKSTPPTPSLKVEGLDGRWATSAGKRVVIKADLVTLDHGGVAKLTSRRLGEFALRLEGVGECMGTRESEHRLEWSDGDIWTRDCGAALAPSDSVEAPEVSQQQLAREKTAEASRKRIAAAGGKWHEVLGVSAGATGEDVRRAFHELALLHHPDKGADNDSGATFRMIQAAHEESQRALEQRNAEASPATAEAAVAVPRSDKDLQTAINLPKKELKVALDRWEDAMDRGKSNHVPDDIPISELEDIVELLESRQCLPVDCRQPEEKYGAMKDPVPGAIHIGYAALLRSPFMVIPQIAELLSRSGHGADGRTIVCYSTHGGTSGNCAAVACALADVFGISDENLCTLSDGYIGWKKWREKNVARYSKLLPPK